jgi:hypothetical protein
VLEVIDGVVVVKPLANVSVVAERGWVVGGRSTYPVLVFERGVVNGVRFESAQLLLRYPNVTFTRARVVLDGVPYVGNDVSCSFMVADGPVYCWGLYASVDGRRVLSIERTNPPLEDLRLYLRNVWILPFAALVGFLAVLLMDLLDEGRRG